MLNKEKRSLDDLDNGEKSKSNEDQDSVNAEPINEVKLKIPKIDLERVRAKADQSIDLGVTTEYTMIPIRNPKPDEFFRCMPDEDYSMDAHILSLKTENEWYMIDPDILPEIQLESQLRVRTVYVCVTMNSTPFVTCIPQHDEMGKINSWHQSGHITMEEAKQCWVRRQADKANGGYTITKAINAMLPDPKWPTMTLNEIIGRAFDKFYIDDINHPVLQRLRGEMMS
ncbi:MAG: hypothetical protein ABGX43_03790 [Nitrospinaceae bacterium]|jgi:hypothetical protein|nr:hypothetical protein [Candidatus Lambdaproteobacteria bacterium]HIK58049.1 hypothetical protein [Nitrospinaceae bacterium]